MLPGRAVLLQAYDCDNRNIAPGHRFDVRIDSQAPGAWRFHCHILSHAESNHGMFGRVTASFFWSIYLSQKTTLGGLESDHQYWDDQDLE